MSAMELKLTHHATTRLAQRGFRYGDAELIKVIGTEVEGGYLVLRKDVRDFERYAKSLLEQMHRLVGKRLVVDGDSVVTGYHATPGKERRLLKKF